MHIDPIRAGKNDGRIGLTVCPGVNDPAATNTGRRRSLEADVSHIKAWKAKALVSALEYEELQGLGILDLGVCASRAGIWWFRVPVPKGKAPDDRFWRAWPNAAPSLLQLLRQGERIVIHCDGTFGRSGLTACCLLQELGDGPNDALRAVRAAQPKAVDGGAQELFVHQYLPRFPEHTRLKKD
ncbi:MAG TPA: hypothetical protein VLV87_02710 [Gammaproteobacteria bacterium]|nr:hypothetical protein [Gammaproteobacteria bacterium]